MESTREMAEMASWPTEETITVSAIPTVTSSTCSTTRGKMSRPRSRAENIIRKTLSCPGLWSPRKTPVSYFLIFSLFLLARKGETAKSPEKAGRICETAKEAGRRALFLDKKRSLAAGTLAVTKRPERRKEGETIPEALLPRPRPGRPGEGLPR